jgi:hypothetical protein
MKEKKIGYVKNPLYHRKFLECCMTCLNKLVSTSDNWFHYVDYSSFCACKPSSLLHSTADGLG